MKYPNSNKIYHKVISHAKRGMQLEDEINRSNKYYLENNLAVIHKKATPIGIVNVANEGKRKIITKAFFKEPSTLDYNGVYKKYYIEFDAKESKNKTSFPLQNISNHQIEHIKNVINQSGIVFLIININNANYLLDGQKLIDYINNEKRKSIPVKVLDKIACKILGNNIISIDYLKIVDELIGGANNDK